MRATYRPRAAKLSTDCGGDHGDNETRLCADFSETSSLAGPPRRLSGISQASPVTSRSARDDVARAVCTTTCWVRGSNAIRSSADLNGAGAPPSLIWPLPATSRMSAACTPRSDAQFNEPAPSTIASRVDSLLVGPTHGNILAGSSLATEASSCARFNPTEPLARAVRSASPILRSTFPDSFPRAFWNLTVRTSPRQLTGPPTCRKAITPSARSTSFRKLRGRLWRTLPVRSSNRRQRSLPAEIGAPAAS